MWPYIIRNAGTEFSILNDAAVHRTTEFQDEQVDI